MNKKLISSKDVFLEDQLFNDFEKVEKPKSSYEITTSVDLVPTPCLQDDDGRVEQEEYGENVKDEAPIIDDIELVEQVEQASPSPLVEISLRISTRERQSYTIYLPNEYVTLIDGGELETYEEAILHENKREWVKAMQEEMRCLRTIPKTW